MLTEVSRLSEAYADLARAQKQVFANSKGGGSDICFFQITDNKDVTEQIGPLAGTDSYSGPRLYTGIIKIYSASSVAEEDEPEPTEEEEGAIGWDMSININTPLTSPTSANLYADRLAIGTVVIAQLLKPDVCIFSSTMPRISVECTG